MELADGKAVDAGEGCFLEVIENERNLFTDARQGGSRPNETACFSAIINLTGHPDGTLYSATVMDKNAEGRQNHAEMGFLDGWRKAIEQLGRLAETLE